MKKIILFLIVFVSLTAFAQNEIATITKLNTVFFECDQTIGQDQFGSNYYITNNVFHKMKEGKTLEYKNVSLGKITAADSLNTRTHFHSRHLLKRLQYQTAPLNAAPKTTTPFPTNQSPKFLL